MRVARRSADKACAWDYEGHHTINELALDSLPADFGGFQMTPERKSRIEYLAGEPDRWRNIGDLPLEKFSIRRTITLIWRI